ncbi:MAG: XRE family transcriptional regulator [Erysipelotrichaceae bacterium]
MDIGYKLKQLRIKNALTLEELASRCELTKGFLSQVERNLTSPSVSTLNDILEALGISLALFFQEAKEERVVFTQDDFFVDEQEDCTIHWIVPNAQKNEMEPILLELNENGISQTIDPHEGEEFGYVIQGKIILVNGEDEHPLKKGETFYISGKSSHYLKNTAKQKAQVLWITTPPIF